MKTAVVLLSAILAFTSSNAQNPHRLVDPTSKWYEYGQWGGWGVEDLQRSHHYYFFDGDTLIGGNAYQKMFFEGRDSLFSNPPLYDTFVAELYYHNYEAAFRQDSLKVWFVPKDSVAEHLYCDFDLAVGDSLKYYYHYGTTEVVSAIDSISFGTTYRKKFLLNNGFSFYEGIGHVLGLNQYALGIEGGVYLVCFQQGGIEQYVYHFPNPVDCLLENNVSIAEAPELPVVEIFPNPFSERVNITLSHDRHRRYAMDLLDMHGRMVRSISDDGSGKVTIERQDLKAGVYALRIQTGNGVVTKKLVVEQ